MQRMAEPGSTQKILQGALADSLLNRLRGRACCVQTLEAPKLLDGCMQSHNVSLIAFGLVPAF
jgi:hypothetical protein